MSVIYYCDAPSCVKKAAGQIGPEGWDSPPDWHGIANDGQHYDLCGGPCVDKMKAEIDKNRPKEEDESEEQTITPDDVGTLKV